MLFNYPLILNICFLSFNILNHSLYIHLSIYMIHIHHMWYSVKSYVNMAMYNMSETIQIWAANFSMWHLSNLHVQLIVRTFVGVKYQPNTMQSRPQLNSRFTFGVYLGFTLGLLFLKKLHNLQKKIEIWHIF